MIQDSKEIGEEAVKVFTDQFIELGANGDYSMIECVPKIITE